MKVKDLLFELVGNGNILSNNVLFIDFVDGNHSKAQFLSQLFYWTGKSNRKDGYFAKSYAEWYEEIRVKKHSIKRYADEFIETGFLQTKVIKFNGYPTVHYKLDSDNLIQSLVTFCNNRKLQFATMESDTVQLSKVSDNLQLTSNRDYQRLQTETTHIEGALAKKNKSVKVFEKKSNEEIFRRAAEISKQREAEHLGRIQEEDLDTVSGVEKTWMDVAREMADYYHDEGRGAWEMLCNAAGISSDKADPMTITTLWAGKASQHQLNNWHRHTGRLSNWIRNHYRVGRREARIEAKNTISQLQSSGTYDGDIIQQQ